jgi:hypothetical protein
MNVWYEFIGCECIGCEFIIRVGRVDRVGMTSD